MQELKKQKNGVIGMKSTTRFIGVVLDTFARAMIYSMGVMVWNIMVEPKIIEIVEQKRKSRTNSMGFTMES